MADDCELSGVEANRTLAAAASVAEEPIPGFNLKPHDCARLQDILNEYGPYQGGQTAVFWHIVSVIGAHRRPVLENPRTPAGKLLGVEIEPPCSCGCGAPDPFCWHHGVHSTSDAAVDGT